MTNRFQGIILVLAGLAFPGFALTATGEDSGAQDSWELRRENEGIRVFTRPVEGSPYNEVMAVTEVNGVRLSSMVALIKDVEACNNWADRCVFSSVHETISDTEFLIYTENNLPFPVKDRDILSRVSWTQHPQTLEVVMESQAANGILEEKKGLVRLTDADVSWHFLPLAPGLVRVTNRAHVDPGSPLPGWLVNMLLVETPFNTLKQFRLEAAKPKYADAVVGFVEEPGDSLKSQ